MDTMEALLTRRSIRQYEDKPVPEEMIRQILEAAMMAPSALNAQTWQFVVITERARLDAIAEVHPYVKMALQVPVGVLVCGDLTKEKFPGYWVQDCSAAMENLLLAAHGLGLGSVWTGIYPMEERMAAYRAIAGLPEHIVPFGFAPIGWPAQQPKSPSRFQPERVHYNTFQE
jgi:nitroreductase